MEIHEVNPDNRDSLPDLILQKIAELLKHFTSLRSFDYDSLALIISGSAQEHCFEQSQEWTQ